MSAAPILEPGCSSRSCVSTNKATLPALVSIESPGRIMTSECPSHGRRRTARNMKPRFRQVKMGQDNLPVVRACRTSRSPGSAHTSLTAEHTLVKRRLFTLAEVFHTTGSFSLRFKPDFALTAPRFATFRYIDGRPLETPDGCHWLSSQSEAGFVEPAPWPSSVAIGV